MKKAEANRERECPDQLAGVRRGMTVHGSMGPCVSAAWQQSRDGPMRTHRARRQAQPWLEHPSISSVLFSTCHTPPSSIPSFPSTPTPPRRHLPRPESGSPADHCRKSAASSGSRETVKVSITWHGVPSIAARHTCCSGSRGKILRDVVYHHQAILKQRGPSRVRL